jgi:hypothetical protein
MAKLFLTPLDLGKLELLNARIQNLSSAPSSPVEGQIYFDTTLHQFGCYQNGTWTYLAAAGGSGNVSQSANSGASGRMKVSAGADKTIQDLSGVVGLIKTDTNGLVSAAAAGTDYVTASSSNALTNKTIDANGTGNAITNLETADFAANVIDTDVTLAANSDTRLATQKAVKAYADGIAQGLRWKQPVRAATTAAGTLASSFANASVIDGVTLATGDRILIKDQAAGAENGIYTVNASGAPTRATDADTAAEIKDAVIPVEAGTVNADKAFKVSNDGTITLGTTALTFIDFNLANVPAASTSVAGKVQLATSTEAEAKSDSSKALTPASVVNFPVKKTFTIGDGSTTAIACTHNLGTRDVVVMIYNASTFAEVIADVVMTSTSVVTITFATAPASNAYKVVIIG